MGRKPRVERTPEEKWQIVQDGDGKIVTNAPSVFDEQLKIRREEYWRTHPR